VLFTITDRKGGSNRERKITNPVELSLLQLRDQALHLHHSQENLLLQSQENLLELELLSLVNFAFLHASS
jgi:hypothetical protein